MKNGELENSIGTKLKVRYKDENVFNKGTRSLKMYNMGAYKDLVFYYVPKIRQGVLLGEKVDTNLYRCILNSDRLFKYVYGDVYFTYQYNKENNEVVLLTIEPNDFLLEGHRRVLEVYQGVAVLGPKEKFKVDMYKAMMKDRR